MSPPSAILVALLVGFSAAQDGPQSGQTPFECGPPQLSSSNMIDRIKQLKTLNQAGTSLAQYVVGVKDNSTAPLEVLAVQNAIYAQLLADVPLMTGGEADCGDNCTRNYTTAEQTDVTNMFTLFADSVHNYTSALTDRQPELVADIDGHIGVATLLNLTFGQVGTLSSCVLSSSPTQKDAITTLSNTLLQDYNSTIALFKKAS